MDSPLDRARSARPNGRWVSAIAWAGLLGCLAIVLFVSARRILLSDARSLAMSIQDDSFYYLLPAFNLSRVGFFSFDGQTPTYGFQPLYMLLLALCGTMAGGLEPLLRAALLINSVAFCGCAVLIYAVAGEVLRDRSSAARALIPLAAAAFYLQDMVQYLSLTTGKENALAALLLAGLTLVVVRGMRPSATPPPASERFGMGLLAGLLILCRILPSTLLSAAVLLIAGLHAPGSRRTVVAGLILPLAAWFCYSSMALERVLPTSGAVKVSGEELLRRMRDSNERAGTLLTATRYVAGAARFSGGYNDRFWMPQPDAWRMGAVNHDHAAPAYRVLALLLVGVAGIRLLVHGAGRYAVDSRVRLLGLLLLAQMAGHFATALLIVDATGLTYYSWYLYDMPVTLACVLAALVGGPRPRDRRSPSPRPDMVPVPPQATRWAVPLAVAGAVAASAITLRVYAPLRPLKAAAVDPSNWQSVMMHVSDVLRAEFGLREDERIGAFSCGALGFALPRQVMNLDGLANDDILRFRAAGGTLQDYFEKEGLLYYADVLPPDELGLACDEVRRIPCNLGGFGTYYVARVRIESPSTCAERN